MNRTTSHIHTENGKHLVVVAPFFFPKLGGVEVYAHEEALRFVKEGWKVSIITSSDSGFGEEKTGGMDIYRLPYLMKISNTPINPMWYFWMKRFFCEHKPDVVHAHAPVPFMADIAARAVGDIPFVLTYHSGSMRKGKGVADIIIGLYELVFLPLMMRKAARIAVVSLAYADEKLSRFKEKIVVISPGVDIARFTPSALPENPGILFVGRVEHSSSWKGIPVLLKAMKQVSEEMPNAKLTLVGGGDALEHYQLEAAELGLSESVTFTGAKIGEDLVNAYKEASVVVLPSTSGAESFGMTLMEGMASGRPVIGSNIGGIPEVIDDERNGLLVEPGDSKMLAVALLSVLNNRQLAEKLAVHGIAKSHDYTWDLQTEKYLKLFQEISPKKQLIAQIVGYYPPHTGGMEGVAESVSNELASRGYPVHVFTSRVGKGKRKNSERSPNLVIKRLFGIEFAHTPILFTLPFHLLFLPKHSVLHVHIAQAGIPELATLIARIRGFRTVGHFHLDIGPTGKLGMLLPLYKKYFLGTSLRACNSVIVFSPEQKKLLEETYRVAPERIFIIPNGVGNEYFNDGARDHKDVLELLYVGRLAMQKRVERLIAMLPLMTTPSHLTIVGDGDERALLEQKVNELHITNVTFAGKKIGEALIEYYRSADVFVIASDVEGMPLVVLEAMAESLPVVATNVLGLRELVKDTGILIDTPYEEGFAKEIDRLGSDTELRAALGRKSFGKAAQFTWKNAVDHMITLYQYHD